MVNLALFSNGSRPYVSSIAYNHHASRINDGVRPGNNASTSDTAWASATERLPHWAAVVFPMAARIERVEIYWGRGCMPESSRSVVVQGWAEGAWITIATVRIPEPEPKTVLSFEPVQVELPYAYGRTPMEARNRRRAGCTWRSLKHTANFGEGRCGGLSEDPGCAPRGMGGQISRGKDGRITREVLDRIDRSPIERPGVGPVGAEEKARARRNRAATAWGRAQAEKILNDASWWLDKGR